MIEFTHPRSICPLTPADARPDGCEHDRIDLWTDDGLDTHSYEHSAVYGSSYTADEIMAMSVEEFQGVWEHVGDMLTNYADKYASGYPMNRCELTHLAMLATDAVNLREYYERRNAAKLAAQKAAVAAEIRDILL